MIGMDVLIAFAVAALILSLSPGPSNLYIMACTMGNGARAGVAAAAVIALASDLFVVTLSSQLGRWLAKSPGWAVRQEQLAGGILFALGAFILLEEVTILMQV
ncbi:hypothetical protein [Alteromonas sp. H39]|uniref:hypothetical protein n=1 Tax=Alteromonas sp. H39 TaxID=3389876 RepID=UPI0039DF41E3